MTNTDDGLVVFDVEVDLPTIEAEQDIVLVFPSAGKLRASQPAKFAAWRDLTIAASQGNGAGAAVAADQFLQHTLTPQDWDELLRMVYDRDQPELDWQHLLKAGQIAVQHFRPAMDRISQALGIALVEDEQEESGSVAPAGAVKKAAKRG